MGRKVLKERVISLSLLSKSLTLRGLEEGGSLQPQETDLAVTLVGDEVSGDQPTLIRMTMTTSHMPTDH